MIKFSNSKTKNSKINVLIGVTTQMFTLILNFVSRTIFINILGEQYLGLNGLFSNILNVLSLAELGFGNALLYSLYKPIAEKDHSKIAALIGFYKKIYNAISLIVLVLGLALLPFLKYLVNLPSDVPYIKIYYMLFVFNTALSYLFSYKGILINADQKSYMIKLYTLAISIAQLVLHIVVLLVTKNYMYYLLVTVCCTLITNILISNKAKKLYPFIAQKVELAKEEIKDIIKNVKSMFIYRISGVVVNNTDNILISVLVGTVSVGYYSNYYMITNNIAILLNTVFTSVYASVGALNAERDDSAKIKIFNALNLIAFICFGICSVCILTLMDDFMYIWIGNEYIFDKWILYAIVLNFYTQGIMNPVWLYKDTTGLFNDVRLCSVFTCIANLVLSIIFGKMWGIFGIIIATTISRIITNFWYHPYKLYKNIFKRSSKEYFLKHIYQFAFIIIVYIVTNILMNSLFNVTNLKMFLIKAVITLVIASIAIIGINAKTEEFKLVYRKFFCKRESEKHG